MKGDPFYGPQTQSKFLVNDSDSQAEEQIDLKNSKNIKIRYKEQQQKQQLQRYARIQKIVLIVLIVLLSLLTLKNLFWQSNRSQAQKDQQTQNLHIKTLKGQRVKLPYLNSELFHPEKMQQYNFSVLKVPDTSQFIQYAQNQTDQKLFSWNLYLNWMQNDEKLFQTQYYLYNKKYGLDEEIPEKLICIMAPFNNLLKYGLGFRFQSFFQAVNSQNYSNYRVYLIDDFSSDNSTAVILQQVKKYPRLNNRIWILKNRQHLGALGNRDSTTRNFCDPGSIVMDIDADDSLIGKQVFNLYNRVYHNNPNVWFFYTNFIAVKGTQSGDGRDDITLDYNKSRTGKCDTITPEIHQKNIYRTDLQLWSTSQLRTYLWDLYMRIPLNYVLQRRTGRYYFQASDRFVMYALAELAGPSHTLYKKQYVYFYYQPNFSALKKSKCDLSIVFFCQAASRILTPLQPLKSLQQEKAKIDPLYNIPKKVMIYYINKQLLLNECTQKHDPMISKIFERKKQDQPSVSDKINK